MRPASDLFIEDRGSASLMSAAAHMLLHLERALRASAGGTSRVLRIQILPSDRGPGVRIRIRESTAAGNNSADVGPGSGDPLPSREELRAVIQEMNETNGDLHTAIVEMEGAIMELQSSLSEVAEANRVLGAANRELMARFEGREGTAE